MQTNIKIWLPGFRLFTCFCFSTALPSDSIYSRLQPASFFRWLALREGRREEKEAAD